MDENVTSKQVAFIIFGVLVGYGIVSLPKKMAEQAGTGGWISLLIATIISLLVTYIIIYLGYTFENKTLYEYSQILLGKTITYIIIWIYIVYFFGISSMVTRISCELIKQSILLRTPIWGLCLTMQVVVFYAIKKKLKVIARVCEIYGIVIAFAVLAIAILTFSQGQLINIRPLVDRHKTFTYFKALRRLILPFLGLEVITYIPLSRDNNKKVYIYSLMMVTFIGLLYIANGEACISVMGVKKIVYYKQALIATIRRIEVPYLEFLKRLDGIFLTSWIMAVYCTIVLFQYGAVIFTNKVFNKIRFDITALIIGLGALFFSQVPYSIMDVEKVLEYMDYLGFIVMIIIPIILFILMKVKRYDKKNS